MGWRERGRERGRDKRERGATTIISCERSKKYKKDAKKSFDNGKANVATSNSVSV